MAKKKPTPKKSAPLAKKPKPSKPRAPAAKPSVKKPPPKPVAPRVPSPVPSPASVDRHREKMAEASREKSAYRREIGPPPPVVYRERRERGRKSLLAFCREYFPRRFKLAFGGPHLVAISRMERCTDEGELFACAMPRGMGKTTLAEVAVLRAVLYGLRRYVVLICATNKLAARRLKQILRQLETNDLLLEDFPEVCFAIRALERIHNRTRGQTIGGVPTRIEMTAESVTLPTLAGSVSSGSLIQVGSMEGAIRGLNVAGPDGEPMRPDMAVIDDAQTRESAKSPIQTGDREAIVTDDILGLVGPDVEIAAVMLCTVMYPSDLSDRFLNPELHPEWQGIRTKMLETMPTNLDLWDEYAEIRRDSFRSGNRGVRATEFYEANREAMDEGAVVSWPERKKKKELSGVQSAMNLYYTNRRGFLAEYQNEPEREGGSGTAKELIPANVAGRVSGLDRFAVPTEATRLTAMIDVHGHLLWYAIVAWDETFGGKVIDYGTWPRQGRTMFAHNDPRPGMADVYPNLVEKERVYAGLRDLANEILGRAYYRDASREEKRVDRCLVDAGWLPNEVYQFCRHPSHRGVIIPSIGISRATTRLAISEWKQTRAGERIGHHWCIGRTESGLGQVVKFDPDAWKSEIYARLTAQPGGRGHLSFYGTSAGTHELIGEHCGAETAEPITLRGATFDKWAIRQHKPDNHLLDVLVGCAVAASTLGLVWDSGAASGQPVQSGMQRKPRLTLAQKMAMKGPPRVIETKVPA